jgi:hypothetical protein
MSNESSAKNTTVKLRAPHRGCLFCLLLLTKPTVNSSNLLLKAQGVRGQVNEEFNKVVWKLPNTHLPSQCVYTEEQTVREATLLERHTRML